MAVLTATELSTLRRDLDRLSAGVVSWTKPQVNAAIQAVIDRLELPGTQTTISNDIEAVAPGVFNGTQKRRIFVLATLITAKQGGAL